ncbi:RICIN domain-containing protein [Micromonospora sp. NPDC049523]|uniref:RICIN domain-containing protein n=1 Tax=Micromonospora sp. NPDC049523 TaxID=3155921 RepID=UPI0034272AE9
MPTSDPRRRPPGGTVYGAPAPARPGRDRLMTAALATGGVGVLIGVLFATGIFAGDGNVDRAAVPAPAGVSGGAAPPAPSGVAAGSTEPAPPPSPTPAEIPTRIFRSVASSFCLALNTNDNPDGAQVQQRVCTGDLTQQWRPTPVVGDEFSLVNAGTGGCLEAADGNKDDGARLHIAVCDRTVEQRWRLAGLDTGQVSLVNLNSGRCADVPENTLTSPDTSLQQWACHGRANQQWAR